MSADASSYRLGAVLLQKQSQGELKPASYISRSMTITKQRYVQIERVFCADLGMWTLYKLSAGVELPYSHGSQAFGPLVEYQKPRGVTNPCSAFSLRISHVPGKPLVIADTLSHAPAEPPGDSDREFEMHFQAFVNTILQSIPATEQNQQIRESQQKDSVCVLKW